MKRLLTSILLLCGVPLLAADSTIHNLPAVTTVPDAYETVFEFPTIADFHITFQNLTNQVLYGMASQGYANSAANGATNGFPWGALYDPANAAHNVTNGFPWGVLYDPANSAHNATNGFPWGVLYDSAGTANTASNAVMTYATGVSNAMMTASNALEVYTTGVSNLVSSGGSATNVPVLLAGTNVLIQVNGLTNTINATINTNVLATTAALNGVSNSVNSAVSYTTGVSNNVQGAITYTTGVSNNVQGAITYTTGVSNLIAGATSNPNALTNYDARSWTNNTMIAGNGAGLTNLNYQTTGLTNWVGSDGTIVVSNSTLGVALFIAYTNGTSWGYSNKVIGGTYYGDGTGISNVVARYVSGTLSNTVYGSNVSGTVSSAQLPSGMPAMLDKVMWYWAGNSYSASPTVWPVMASVTSFGTWVSLTNVGGAYGLERNFSAATANSQAGLVLNSGSCKAEVFVPTRSGFAQFQLGLTNISSERALFGMASGFSSNIGAEPTATYNWMCFKYVATNSANWKLCTGNSVGVEANDTGVQVVTNTQATYKIAWTSNGSAITSAVASINGTPVCTNTTYLPTTGVSPFMLLTTQETVSKAFDFVYYYAEGNR